jgi:formylglycine-generating enzyme required for sulfatase activity
MKQLTIITFMLCGLLSVASALAAGNDGRNLAVAAGSAKRVALVIGNDHYQHVGELNNAVADARSIAAALKKAGFAVTLKSDADLDTMKQAVRQFKASLSGGDEAIFFYSGHGVQLGAANYLLPVNITSDSEEQVKDDAIPLQRLLDDLQDQKVKFALAIIDACRDNPFKGSGRSIGGTRGLAPTSAANGQMVIFSAGTGQQALDKLGNTDRDGNGVFTRVFLQEMEKPGIEVHQVLRNVRSRVVQMAKSVNHDQMPALYDQVEGDFYFYGSGTQVASLEPVPAPPPVHVKSGEEIEQESWESAKGSNDIDAVKEYLKQYPQGRFVSQAKILIATLKKSPAQAALAVTENPAISPDNITLPPVPAAPRLSNGANDAESMTWAEAVKGNTTGDYKLYLDSYPNGMYAKQAAEQKQKLEAYAKASAEAAAAQKEDQAWNTAQQDNSETGYNQYLKHYAAGRYAALAKMKTKKAHQEAFDSKGPQMVPIPGRNYEIGKYDVTQGEWLAVMGNNPSRFTNCGDNCPVETVSWDDIQTFLQKLNAKTGKQYRLPTEAEWEYACYGGSQTEYCGSNDIDAVAWYGNNGQPGGNSNQTTHPVGQKQANGYGLYDMSGNVCQWMENKYDNKPDWRALRGGSWDDKPQLVRAAFRNYYDPALRGKLNGFRLARTLP